MGKQATNINIYRYYGGGIYCSISSNEGRLTFCESYEGYLVHTQDSRRHPEGAVHYFIKSSHTSQRYSRGNHTRGCSENLTS